MTTDDLKQQRDGHLYAGPKIDRRPPWTDEVMPYGHSMRVFREGGAIEYAPVGCACPRCRPYPLTPSQDSGT